MKKVLTILVLLCASCTKQIEVSPDFDKSFELAHKRWEREIKTNPPTGIIVIKK